MPDYNEMILDRLKDITRSQSALIENVAELKGELLSEVRHLGGEIKNLRESDEKLHRRIDRKDDRFRELEKEVVNYEKRFESLETRIETNSKNNKWWIMSSFSLAIVIATMLAKYL